MLLATVIVGGFLAHNWLSKYTQSRQLVIMTSVRAFSSKKLHQTTNGFLKLLGKGSFGGVYQGTVRSSEPRLIREAALGIAKGIEYLHEGYYSLITHCDIKPDNIHLDDMNNSRITAWGSLSSSTTTPCTPR
uniref:Protein kinase domain-containing protein n=1 Tax=Oryza rufipogon TaxID=4529 RepID=A0A0E0Q080_ORYRU